MGWLRERMKKLGFVFRRPKKDLRHLQDPQQRDAADEWLKEAKKASATADFELLFVDESTVTQDFSIRACWMKRGQQKRLPAPPGANAFHHVTGALNWRSQQVTYTLAKTKNSETFIEFLEHLLEVAYPQKRIVLVMDNAPWHRSHAVQAVLSLYESQALDDTLEGAIADLDAETRFAVGWFEEQGFQAGDFGRANVLAQGKNTAVESVALAGLVEARGGKVRLINWREYDPGTYDPAQDQRLTVWEAAHHLIERLNHHGETGAAALYAKLPADMPDAARDLAYRLYHVCDRKSWAEDARDYNALVSSWSEISRLAGSREQSGAQDKMFGN